MSSLIDRRTRIQKPTEATEKKNDVLRIETSPTFCEIGGRELGGESTFARGFEFRYGKGILNGRMQVCPSNSKILFEMLPGTLFQGELHYLDATEEEPEKCDVSLDLTKLAVLSIAFDAKDADALCHFLDFAKAYLESAMVKDDREKIGIDVKRGVSAVYEAMDRIERKKKEEGDHLDFDEMLKEDRK